MEWVPSLSQTHTGQHPGPSGSAQTREQAGRVWGPGVSKDPLSLLRGAGREGVGAAPAGLGVHPGVPCLLVVVPEASPPPSGPGGSIPIVSTGMWSPTEDGAGAWTQDSIIIPWAKVAGLYLSLSPSDALLHTASTPLHPAKASSRAAPQHHAPPLWRPQTVLPFHRQSFPLTTHLCLPRCPVHPTPTPPSSCSPRAHTCCPCPPGPRSHV